MEYDNIICVSGKIDGRKCRFILRKEGDKPLILIGLNPSTADETAPDATIRKIIGFIDAWKKDSHHGYDSFIMLNLYPLIETFPDELSKNPGNKNLHKRNLEKIASVLKEYPQGDVLLCYGDSIDKVSWLKEFRDDILNMIKTFPEIRLFQLGDPTISGNPRHPSRLSYSVKLRPFE